MGFLKKLSYEKKKAMYGRMFILPWVLGFFIFFAFPILESLYQSFCDIKIVSGDIVLTLIGFDNYNELLFRNIKFIPAIAQTLVNMIEVPIIIAFSLFIALILNNKFKGRTLVRAIFFLPVIISSGITILILKSDPIASSMVSSSQSVAIIQATGLADIMAQFGIPSSIISAIQSIISQIFDLSWKSGVQILLFLSGLQSIPKSHYEAARIEGCTEWETFWKITFPMLGPVILVTVVYTIVDSFTYYSNPVMNLINTAFQKDIKYALASAMSWGYFLIIMIILGATFKIVNKRIYYIE